MWSPDPTVINGAKFRKAIRVEKKLFYTVKKVFILSAALFFASSMLVSCGSKETKVEETTLEDQTGASSTPEESTTPEETPAPEASGNDCEKFCEEYESFVDDYIELAKKVKSNPTDVSIMGEYSEMAGKAAEMAKQAKDCAGDPAIAARIAKIAAKMATIK